MLRELLNPGAPPIQEKDEARKWLWQWGSEESSENTGMKACEDKERELLSVSKEKERTGEKWTSKGTEGERYVWTFMCVY